MIQAREPYTLLDVRREDELAISQYPQPFLHIEMSQVAQRLSEIPHDYPVVVACRSGGRSAKAAQILAQNGFENVFNLAGGMLAWSEMQAASTSSAT